MNGSLYFEQGSVNDDVGISTADESRRLVKCGVQYAGMLRDKVFRLNEAYQFTEVRDVFIMNLA